MGNCKANCKCKKEKEVPSYYVGNHLEYKAKDIVWDYDLSYNIGTAVTYLLRAKSKHDTPTDCIKKAIHHLEFELQQLENDISINKDI
tara:strand:- start:11702 stop:11965 length:264 start_codon:yes stop_codon:yes gene_type:complete